MKHLDQLLAALVALTLVLSVASVANPNYFTGLNVYADDDEEEDDDDHSGSNGSDDDDDQDDDNGRDDDDDDHDNSGKGSNNKGSKDDDDDDGEAEDEDEQDDDEHEEDEEEHEEEDDDEEKLVQSLGNQSKVELEVDDDHVDLEVEIEDSDLEDGTYDVAFDCTSPDISKEFAQSLTVQGGEGEFEAELMLANGTYTGCEVEVGGLSAAFASFTVALEDDDDDEHEEEDKEEHEDEAEEEDDKERDHDEKFKSKLKTEDDGVEIEVEIEGLNMTDGSYDAVFACESPEFSVTLTGAFDVHNGKGKLKETIGLANNTYSGCDITVEGTSIASFDTFTVSEETEEEQERRVEVKREEKKQRIVSTTSGHEIHEKHRKATPASPGDYDPGWNYTLSADGSAMESDENTISNATVTIDMAVWKSTRAIVLLDVLNGTIELDDQQYTVKVGYVIYSTQHGAMKVAALAVDGDGNIVKLRLFGNAAEEGVQFPAESGAIDLIIVGSVHQSSGISGSLDWDLVLDGEVTAT
jgi:hypothetical protein